MNKDVYLFELDISHSGQKILFKKNNLDKYFKSYLLISNHVYLQASAPMKIKEVYELFLKYQDCFKFNNIDKIPLVSFVLSQHIYSYEEYLDQRLDKLSNAHINAKKNFEYNAYKVNNAQILVKSLDKKIITKNNGFYFKTREKSVDTLFRKKVSLLFQDDEIIQKFKIKKKQQKELIKYPNDKNRLFQTFEFSQVIRNDFKINNSHKLIKSVREMYYIANQEAVSANSSMIDIHFNINYINRFYHYIGIIKYINKIDSCKNIFELRENEHFIFLKNLYFKFINKESLEKLQYSFALGGFYKFIHFSYDYLIPLALAVLLYGLDVLNSKEAMVSVAIFGFIKDITKDILQNIIARWLSSIPEYSEYKIYQEKKLLKESLVL